MSPHTHTQSHILSHTHTLITSSTSHTHTQSHILSYTYPITYPLSYTYPTTCRLLHIPNHMSPHTHTQSHILSHTHTLITSSTSHTLTQSHILSYTCPITRPASHTHTSVISPHPSTPQSHTSQFQSCMHNLIASSPIYYYYVYIFSSV